MTEQWKPVTGYEDLYEVSDLGRVRSLGRTIVKRNRWGTITENRIKPRVLKILHCQADYCYVHLFDLDGRSTNHKVHRLVAAAFVPNPDGLDEVNHIDENKDNNRADNLEWCTHIDNCNHGTRTERVIVHTSKAVIQMDTDGNIIAEYPSVSEASRQTGVQRAGIRGCANGDSRFTTAGGYLWKFKD